MANTLTGLIPTLYEALNTVSREMVGLIPAVYRDANAERAGLNQTIRVPIAEAGELEDVTPGVNPASSGDTTVDYADITISKSKVAPIRWNGEEQKAVGTNGTYNQILSDQFADGMRKLVNAMEIDLAATVKGGASRAYGTAGTAPFGTAADLSDFAGVRQILEENGAPLSDLQLALGSAAIANLRGKQSVLFKVNEAGTSDMLRDGMTDRVQGFALRNSAGIRLHTKGTGSGFLVNGALPVGSETIAVDTGTGTILQGDITTFASDTNKYVVNQALAGGSFGIGDPGLRQAVADNAAITIGNSYTPNAAFSRNAVVLVSRAPAVPEGGDSADDAMMLTDPMSGLTFEVRVYRQYRQVKYEIGMAWGQAVVKPEHVALLIG
ncbi:P22 phage major capsid protein family protein [Pacificimonas sp. ICDLI1SI03]